MSGTITSGHSRRQAALSRRIDVDIDKPMTTPPTRDANVPIADMPPFVPGGTGLNVVISLGGDLDRIPSSEARVSPKQQPKWLNQFQRRQRIETGEIRTPTSQTTRYDSIGQRQEVSLGTTLSSCTRYLAIPMGIEESMKATQERMLRSRLNTRRRPTGSCTELAPKCDCLLLDALPPV